MPEEQRIGTLPGASAARFHCVAGGARPRWLWHYTTTARGA
ncbi:MAG TPA: hypothetical protein VGC89_16455 [Pyrinomonadaceae bacterium]